MVLTVRRLFGLLLYSRCYGGAVACAWLVLMRHNVLQLNAGRGTSLAI